MFHSSASLSVITDEQACRTSWREAVLKCEDLSPFLHPAFQEGLANIVPWRRVIIGDAGGIRASAFLRKRGPVGDLVLPPFCPYSAILPAAQGQEFHLPSLLLPADGLPKTRLFSFSPDVDGSLFEGNSSVEIRTRYTYHLPTAPLETAIQGWSPSQRRSFRKHQGAYSFVAPDPLSNEIQSVVHDLVELTQEGYARHHRLLPLGNAGLASWAAHLVQSGPGRLYTLRNKQNNGLEAGLLALHHSPMAWYWLAGSRPGPAMTVLLAHVQDDLHHTGIPTLDLMGANTPGISEFKRRFGGKKVAYTHVRTSSFLGRMAERAAQTLRRSPS